MTTPVNHFWDPITKEYTVSRDANRDPLESTIQGIDVWLHPANSTTETLPEYTSHQIPVWDETANENAGGWVVMADFRDATVVDLDNKPVIITEIGPLPANTINMTVPDSYADKLVYYEKRIKLYGLELRRVCVYIDGIHFCCSNDGITNLEKVERWLNNPLNINNIIGTLTEIVYDASTLSTTIPLGTLSGTVEEGNSFILSDGVTKLVVASVTTVDTNLVITFADPGLSSDTYAISSVHGTPYTIWQVTNEDGTFYPIIMTKKYFDSVVLCIMDYIQAGFKAQYYKKAELSTYTEENIDTFDITTGWPSSTYTLDENGQPTALQFLTIA